MSGTTYNIKIVLSTHPGSSRRDLDGVGESAGRAERGLGAAGRAAEGSGRQFASLGGLVKEAAANFAGYLSAQAVFAGLQKAAKFAYDTIIGFDQQMTESLAIMGNQAEGTRRAMELTARSVAVDYNMAVEDVAQAYYFLASAGYDAETSQKAVGQVTAFAKAGMFDLEQATELAADAQNAMGLKSADSAENLEQLTRITDVLTKANIDANGSVQDFAKALTNKAAAGARLAGVSLESTVAVLEAFAAQGLKGKRAGEAFTIVLRDLQDKAQENGEAFDKLGIKVFDAQGNFAGFPQIIGQLEKSLKGMSVEQANATINTLGFTAEGGAYLKTLLGMSGAIAEYETKLKSAGGATQEIARKQMQSMAEQLKHLKVLAAEAALQGFDKLVQAGQWLSDKFGPSLSNIVEIIKDLAHWLTPIGKLMAEIAGGAVIMSLTALAAVLQTVSKWLRDNAAVVELLATVGLAVLAARALQAGAAFLSMAADLAAFKAFDMARYIDNVIDAFSNLRAGFVIARQAGAGMTQAMASAVSAMFGTASAAVAAGVGLVGVGVAIYAVMKWYQQGEQAADEFNQAVGRKYNVSSLQGLRDTLRETQAEVDRLGHMGSTIGERFNLPEMIRADAEYNKLKDTVSGLTDTLQKREGVFWDMAKALKAGGDEGSNTALTIGQIHDKLDQIATQEKIDPVTTDGAAKLKELATQALIASPATLQLRDAFAQVAQASSTAEDAVKAYKQALDALIGVHISSMQAENQFAASLDTVHGKLGAGVNLMDAYNARNREARDAVLNSASAAMDHAVAIYQETGSLTQANAVLGFHREQLINSMVQTGMSRTAAEQYIATLNLTPKNIETLARMNKDQASAAALELTREVNEAARPRVGSIDIDTSTASGKVRALKAEMSALDRRAVNQMGLANGGIIAPYADGGVQRFAGGGENHVAQIASAGAMRLWAEPETGGEAYIPLSMAKRERSAKILRAVAEMFGMQVLPQASGSLLGSGMYGATITNAERAITQAVLDARANTPQIAAHQAMQAWARTQVEGYRQSAMTYSQASGVNIHLGSGMIQVHAGPGTDMNALNAMLNRALAEFSRNLRTELRTRRVMRAA